MPKLWEITAPEVVAIVPLVLYPFRWATPTVLAAMSPETMVASAIFAVTITLSPMSAPLETTFPRRFGIACHPCLVFVSADVDYYSAYA